MASNPCRHDGCSCEADETGFCSEYCGQHVGEGHETHDCDCGHPGCE